MAVGIDGDSIFGPPEIAVRLPNSLNPGNQTAQTAKLAGWQTVRLADWKTGLSLQPLPTAASMLQV